MRNSDIGPISFQEFSGMVVQEIQASLNGKTGKPKEVYPCFLIKPSNSSRIQVVHIQQIYATNQTEAERGCHALGEKFRKVFDERGFGEIEYLSFFCEAVVCSSDSEAHDKIFKVGHTPDMDLMSQIASEIEKSPTPGQVAKQHGVEHGVVMYLGNVPERFCGMISYKLTSDRTDISELGRETVDVAWPMDSFICGFNGVPFDFYRNHDVDIKKLINSPLGKQLLEKIEHLIDTVGSQRKRTVQDHLNNMRN